MSTNEDSNQDTVTISREQYETLVQQVDTLAETIVNSSSTDHQWPPPKRKDKLDNSNLHEIIKLIDCIPKYTGSKAQSLELWKTQVDDFLNTFNLSVKAIEPYLYKLFQGKALAEYKNLQIELKRKKGLRYPSWNEIITNFESKELDNNIDRSLTIHHKIQQQLVKKRRNCPHLGDLKYYIDQFKKLERELDPAPLGDRLFLLFQVIPFSRQLILLHINQINSMDDACDLILTANLSAIKYCTYCFKTNHASNQCNIKK